jgi:small subunit ribosomal protein S6
MIRNYELIFIIAPGLATEIQDQVIEKISNIITTNNGKIQSADRMGLKRLSYDIKGKNEGFYVVIKFEGEKEMVSELDRVLKIQEEILKHIILNNENIEKKEKIKAKAKSKAKA